MNIIICDDRISDRKNLSDLLSDYGEKKNYEFAITEYDSGEQLCEEQSALEACQILFLDINMQGMDGLKTAMRIKEKYPKLPVVLVTAYMNYALDGYKVKASRFLLKDNLADTIEECMDDLIAEINKNRRILEFRFVEGTIKLYADDIIYIETELHKNVFYTEKGTFQIYKKLDELEKELSAEFDIENRAELAVQMQQTVLDDHAFVFCSFLKMSMISKANVTGYESHACDYYQVTADLDIN